MNTYTTRFFATCPANGIRIDYQLTITTPDAVVVRVEDITTTVDQIHDGYHEEIADQLQAALGGEQVLTADHHGVHIETTRTGTCATN